MQAAILDFVDLLRRNRVRVSSAEVLEALQAAQLVGLGAPGDLGEALAATLIKRPEDQPAFEELFRLYFRRGGRALLDEAPLAAALRERGVSEEELEHLLALLADEAARLDPTARLALGLAREQLGGLLRLAGVQVNFDRLLSPLQVGYFTQQVLEQLRIPAAETALRGLAQRLGRSIGAERAAQVLDVALDNLQRLRGGTRRLVQEEFEKRNLRYQQQMRSQLLAYKPLGQMSAEELARLTDEVRRLALKLRTAASLRPRRVRRGRLDLRQTLRRAVGTDGVPARLCFRRRRKDRPRLLVLCDISDSVRAVSRFMLQFAYVMQELFSKVRSFVFVADLAETTELFARHDLDRAVELLLTGTAVNLFANSNYGRAFQQFQERHLGAVNSRTTVIIIGDGRNNYHPPEAWALGRIKQRARRVLWLNPEPPSSWSFGDSAMRAYEPHVHRVETVNNLATLHKVVSELVLP